MVLYGIRQGSPWALLAWAMKREYGVDALPEVRTEKKGKPFFPTLPHIHFNLSHSGTYGLCALSACPVGIDIEVIRPRRDSLPAYALTRREYALYSALGGDWPAFYALWTRREAWCKYTGDGLSGHWKEDAPNTLLFTFYQGEDWSAAVCGEEEAPKEIIWVEELS